MLPFFKTNKIYKSSTEKLNRAGISQKEYESFLLLRTFHKSGTNFLRIMLTNYLYNLGNETFELIEYDNMHNNIFPNVRMHAVQGKVRYIHPEKDHFIRSLGFSDFIYDHGSELDFDPKLHAKKTILLYRNPLDLLVSQYYYFYENREGSDKNISHPRFIIDSKLPAFCKYFNLIKDRSSIYPEKYYLISYEALIENTKKALVSIITFLGIKTDEKLIDFCIQAASKKQIRETEKKLGHAIHKPKHTIVKGSFARSGKIGQWKDYFSDDEINKITRILSEHDLSVENFQIEPLI